MLWQLANVTTVTKNSSDDHYYFATVLIQMNFDCLCKNALRTWQSLQETNKSTYFWAIL